MNCVQLVTDFLGARMKAGNCSRQLKNYFGFLFQEDIISCLITQRTTKIEINLCRTGNIQVQSRKIFRTTGTMIYTSDC